MRSQPLVGNGGCCLGGRTDNAVDNTMQLYKELLEEVEEPYELEASVTSCGSEKSSADGVEHYGCR